MPTAAIAPPRKLNKFLVGYALSLVTLALLAYLFTSRHDTAADGGSLLKTYASDVSYVNLPRVSLNVGSGSGAHPGRLRMDLSLEVDKKYAAQLEGYVPRITEKLADYTRTLDFDEISQPQAAQLIRKFLIEQANTAGSPVPVLNVLFRQYIII